MSTRFEDSSDHSADHPHRRIYLRMKVIGGVFLLTILCALVFQSNLQDRLRGKTDATVPVLGPVEARPVTEDFPFKSLGGQSHKLSDFRGRVVYLNFWAKWCAPCLEEMPLIEKIAKEYGDKLQVILVNLDSDLKQIAEAQMIQTRLAPSTLAIYENAKAIEEMMNVRALPFHVLVDKAGRTATAFYKSFKPNEKEFRKTLDDLTLEFFAAKPELTAKPLPN